jgi:CheY-like chemotaxis protein
MVSSILSDCLFKRRYGCANQAPDRARSSSFANRHHGMIDGLSRRAHICAATRSTRDRCDAYNPRWTQKKDARGVTDHFEYARRDERHEELLMAKRPLVSVVDDDESVRESLPDLLSEFGFAARAFSSAEQFLASDCLIETKCLILDVAMPGMTGPDLQRELGLRRQRIPIIFITGDEDAAVRQRLLALGAVECLLKPFSDTALRNALEAALQGG